MAPQVAPLDEPPRSRLERLRAYVWGYDFFISYQWSSGGSYASALAAALRGHGFECFLDRSEFAVGDAWKAEAYAALRATQRLIVVATPGAVTESDEVEREVLRFIRFNRRIIVIAFERNFTEVERGSLRVLAHMSTDALHVIEMASVEGNPSSSTIDQLAHAHEVLRRRSLRARLVLGTVLVLSALLVVSTGLGLFAYARSIKAELAQRDAETAQAKEAQKALVATAAQKLNEADLLRETDGPHLNRSLTVARDAYRAAKKAGDDTAGPERAIQAALALMPTPIGSPISPFGKRRSHMEAIDGALVLNPFPSTEPSGPLPTAALDGGVDTAAERPSDPLPLFVVARWSDAGLEARPFHPPGEILLDRSGMPAAAIGTARWVRTRDGNGSVRIWDAATEKLKATLRQGPSEVTVLTISENGDAALTRSGDSIMLWDLRRDSPKSHPINLPARPQLDLEAQYALSPTGKWLVWVAGNGSEKTAWLALTSNPKLNQKLQDPLPWGGEFKGIRFAMRGGRDAGTEDVALVLWWTANPLKQEEGDSTLDSPSYQGATWPLRPGAEAELASRRSLSPSPPIIRPLIRGERRIFTLVPPDGAGSLLAVLDNMAPAEIVETGSLSPVVLGLLPATAGKFSPDPTLREHDCGDFHPCFFVAVHSDGTARVWDLPTRKEVLRLTSENPIVDVEVITRATGDFGEVEVQGFVTQDASGQLQAWGLHATKDTVADVASGAP